MWRAPDERAPPAVERRSSRVPGGRRSTFASPSSARGSRRRLAPAPRRRSGRSSRPGWKTGLEHGLNGRPFREQANVAPARFPKSRTCCLVPGHRLKGPTDRRSRKHIGVQQPRVGPRVSGPIDRTRRQRANAVPGRRCIPLERERRLRVRSDDGLAEQEVDPGRIARGLGHDRAEPAGQPSSPPAASGLTTAWSCRPARRGTCRCPSRRASLRAREGTSTSIRPVPARASGSRTRRCRAPRCSEPRPARSPHGRTRRCRR